jgi:Uncharacterized protein conserved in bacteria (DUF2252)
MMSVGERRARGASARAGISRAEARAAALASVTGYREATADFAQRNTMDIWYASLDESDILRVVHGAVETAETTPLGLAMYGRACGWTLARAHARSGDPVAVAAYLGETDEFDRSVTDFAERYADRSERDYDEFAAAIKDGRLAAVEGI